jgi:hypothetical protein
LFSLNAQRRKSVARAFGASAGVALLCIYLKVI